MNNVTVNLDNLSESERAQVLSIIEKANQRMNLAGVKDGETFKIGDFELIKFPDMDGATPVVSKDIVFISCFGDSNNNLRESIVLKRLEVEVLPKIIAAIGVENLCTIKTDLTTLDGLTPHGEMESLISIPTFDFYRANAKVFDKYKVKKWWWLATPLSVMPHYDPCLVECVAPSGFVGHFRYSIELGVRPFLLFKSSIFESSEE